MFMQEEDDENMISDSTNMMTFIPPFSDNVVTKIEDFGNFEEQTTDYEIDHILQSIREKLDSHIDHGFEEDQAVFNSI